MADVLHVGQARPLPAGAFLWRNRDAIAGNQFQIDVFGILIRRDAAGHAEPVGHTGDKLDRANCRGIRRDLSLHATFSWRIIPLQVDSRLISAGSAGQATDQFLVAQALASPRSME